MNSLIDVSLVIKNKPPAILKSNLEIESRNRILKSNLEIES